MIAKRGEVLSGPAGTATRVMVTLTPDDPPAWQAGIGQWFLDCPGQSPAWRHYWLCGIHLRPIPDVDPATIDVPGATHQITLWALNPAANPDPGSPDSWQMLTPITVAEQVQLPDDTLAARLLEDCARAVVDGILPAEPALSGAVEPWRTVLIKTSAHIRGEHHAP